MEQVVSLRKFHRQEVVEENKKMESSKAITLMNQYK
jgi:hypothetical protein